MSPDSGPPYRRSIPGTVLWGTRPPARPRQSTIFAGSPVPRPVGPSDSPSPSTRLSNAIFSLCHCKDLSLLYHRGGGRTVTRISDLFSRRLRVDSRRVVVGYVEGWTGTGDGLCSGERNSQDRVGTGTRGLVRVGGRNRPKGSTKALSFGSVRRIPPHTGSISGSRGTSRSSHDSTTSTWAPDSAVKRDLRKEDS